jgi:O-methyltransferase
VDLYQPTLEGLKFFYPRLSPGGVMLVHDYNNSRYPVVSKAVHEFFDGGVGFIPIPDKNGSILITKNS